MWEWDGAAPNLGTEPHRGLGLVAFSRGNLGAPLNQHIFGSPFPLAHHHLALTCGPGSLLFFSWLPLICGHPVTAAGLSPLDGSCSCHHNQLRKIGMGMEYLPFDCSTASENSSNSRKTPRNAEPEEEEPCQNDSFSFLLGCGKWSQGKAGIKKPMVVLISCKPGMWGLIVFV